MTCQVVIYTLNKIKRGYRAREETMGKGQSGQKRPLKKWSSIRAMRVVRAGSGDSMHIVVKAWIQAKQSWKLITGLLLAIWTGSNYLTICASYSISVKWG